MKINSTTINAAMCYDEFLTSGGPELEPKLCYDGGTCRNEYLIEDLVKALSIAVTALRQYAGGKTWRHIAKDALKELEQQGLIEEA